MATCVEHCGNAYLVPVVSVFFRDRVCRVPGPRGYVFQFQAIRFVFVRAMKQFAGAIIGMQFGGDCFEGFGRIVLCFLPFSPMLDGARCFVLSPMDDVEAIGHSSATLFHATRISRRSPGLPFALFS